LCEGNSDLEDSFLFRAIDNDGYLHGCNVLYYLVKPWANTDAVVVADSYFASVSAAIRLKSIGLRFIGVIKTATKEYPMQYLGSVPLPGGRGSRKGLLTTDADTGTQLLSFVWVDRDRQYFISTCSSLEEGIPLFASVGSRSIEP
jgi:Transposase IS4